MERPRLHGRLEPGVQLVVERTRSLHRRDVLGHTREVDRAIVGNRESPGEMLREVARSVEADDRHDPTGEQSLDDLPLLVRGRRRAGHRKPRLVAKDLRLEPLELGAGLDPELVDEAGACVLVHLEGLGLPARAIQREHQLSPEGLAQRVLADERLQLADDVAVRPELEISVDPLADDDEAKLLEPADLRLREVVERELRERRPAPERERRLQPARAAPRREAAAHPRARCSKRRASI